MRFLMIVLLVCATASNVFARDYILRNKSNTPLVATSLERISANEVQVTRKKDGREFKIPMSVLSTASQKIVEEHAPWSPGASLLTGVKEKEMTFSEWKQANEKVWPDVRAKLKPVAPAGTEGWVKSTWLKTANKLLKERGMRVTAMPDDVVKKTCPTYHFNNGIVARLTPFNADYVSRRDRTWAEAEVTVFKNFPCVQFKTPGSKEWITVRALERVEQVGSSLQVIGKKTHTISVK